MQPDLIKPSGTAFLSICRWIIGIPIALHFLLLASSVLSQGGIIFGKLDLIITTIATAGVATVALFWQSKAVIPRLALITSALLLPLLLLEGGMRLIQTPAPTPWPRNVKRELRLTVDLVGVDPKLQVTTNSLGLRSPEFSVSDLEYAPLSILCIGGSTTECYYVSDENTWPWKLGDLLTEELGENVIVGNAGRGGHFTLHHSQQIEHYSYASLFDCVIVLCGWNDMSTALYGSYEQRTQEVVDEALVKHPWDLKKTFPPHSAYYRKTALFTLLQRSMLHYESPSLSQDRKVVQDAYGKWIEERRQKRIESLEINPVNSLPKHFEQSLTLYKKNLEKIRQKVSENQTLIFLTQPTIYSKNTPQDYDALTWAAGDFAYTALATYEANVAFNEVLRDFCEENAIACIDLANLLPKDTTVFYDECHFNSEGCHQIARTLANQLPSLLPVEALTLPRQPQQIDLER